MANAMQMNLNGAEAVPARAIDLVHLARQTLGDRALECELLALFERQAGQIVARLTGTHASMAGATRADLAHALKGSALAVGANRVALAAAALEQTASPAEAAESSELQIAALQIAVAEARIAVAHLLAA